MTKLIFPLFIIKPFQVNLQFTHPILLNINPWPLSKKNFVLTNFYQKAIVLYVIERDTDLQHIIQNLSPLPRYLNGQSCPTTRISSLCGGHLWLVPTIKLLYLIPAILYQVAFHTFAVTVQYNFLSTTSFRPLIKH